MALPVTCTTGAAGSLEFAKGGNRHPQFRPAIHLNIKGDNRITQQTGGVAVQVDPGLSESAAKSNGKREV